MKGNGTQVPADAGKETSANVGAHAPAQGNPVSMDPELQANVEMTKVCWQSLKELLASENVGKLISAWSSSRDASGRHAAESTAKIATIQAKHAFCTNVFFLIALTLCLSFLSAIIYVLRGDKDLLLPVLSAVISLIAGTGGGYVFGRRSVTGRAD